LSHDGLLKGPLLKAAFFVWGLLQIRAEILLFR